MSDANKGNADAITDRLRQQAEAELLRITTHAHQEMVEEGVSLEDLITVLRRATLPENYPDHKRGCLLSCPRRDRNREVLARCLHDVAGRCHRHYRI